MPFFRRIGYALLLTLISAGSWAGSAGAADIAVEAIEVQPETPVAGQTCRIRGQVENRGDEQAAQFPVILSINGTEQSRRTVVRLAPETARRVSFSHVFETAGWHLVSIRASAEDDFMVFNDSRRTMVSVTAAGDDDRAENEDDTDDPEDDSDEPEDDSDDPEDDSDDDTDEPEDDGDDVEDSPDGGEEVPEEGDDAPEEGREAQPGDGGQGDDTESDDTESTDDPTNDDGDRAESQPDDDDGDGQTNREEYENGRDPRQYNGNRPPAAPEPLFPDDGASEVACNPTLRANEFSDADTDGHDASHWQISREAAFTNPVLSAETPTRLTALPVPRMVLLPETTYYWRVRYQDNRGQHSPWSDSSRFTTESRPTDQNQDGVCDDHAWLEYSDLDGDGVSDLEQTDMACAVPVVDDTIVIGLKCPTTTGRIDYLEMIDPAAIEDADGRPEHLPAGLLNFRIQMAPGVRTAHLEIFFSNPAAGEPRWIFYNAIDGWRDVSEHAVFRPDMRSVAIEIEDGGPGDADGVANGIIVASGGVAAAALTPSADDDDDGADDSGMQFRAGCFIRSLIK